MFEQLIARLDFLSDTFMLYLRYFTPPFHDSNRVLGMT